MVLEEGEGSLEKVAVEIYEREKEGINEVVSWLLGLCLFVCREPPQIRAPEPSSLAAENPAQSHTRSRRPAWVMD